MIIEEEIEEKLIQKVVHKIKVNYQKKIDQYSLINYNEICTLQKIKMVNRYNFNTILF